MSGSGCATFFFPESTDFLLLEFEVDMLQAIVAIEDTSVVWAKMGLSVLSRIEISACAAVLLG
jgi:hypothetical protein